jgi:hypothetical protein
MEIIDNFLLKKDNKEILELLTHNNFNWFLSGEKYTVKKKHHNKLNKKFKNIYDYIQFTHVFYYVKNKNKINSNYFYLIKKFCETFLNKKRLEKLEILRAKANLQTKLPNLKKHHHNTPHKDFKSDHKVLLYYVNDSDGDTHFFKNNKIFKSISPKANRLVVFDGNILHTGSHPIKSDYRIVLNINCIW